MMKNAMILELWLVKINMNMIKIKRIKNIKIMLIKENENNLIY